MKLRTALLALGAGTLATFGVPAAAHAASDVAVVTVLFTDQCDHTVTVTVANVTDKVGTFQLNEEPGQRTVPVYDTAKKFPGTTTIEHASTFLNERGEDVTRVRLLGGTKLGGGKAVLGTGAGVDRVVHGWSPPATCDQPAGGGGGGGQEPPVEQPVVAAVSYDNCDAVRAAGKAPIKPGDPGWDVKFDRDKDGVGCETGESTVPAEPKPQVPQQPAAHDQADVASLPLTGPSAWWYVAGGVGALVLGGLLKRAGRRRKVALKA